MRPTKRTQATKKESNPVLDKLMKLKYRINDAYNHRQENDGDTKSDKTWVMEEIDNLRNDGWLTATKMKVANEMWNRYGG